VLLCYAAISQLPLTFSFLSYSCLAIQNALTHSGLSMFLSQVMDGQMDRCARTVTYDGCILTVMVMCIVKV